MGNYIFTYLQQTIMITYNPSREFEVRKMRSKIIMSVIGVILLTVVCTYTAYYILDKPDVEIVPPNAVSEETNPQTNSTKLSSSVIFEKYDDLITEENEADKNSAYCYVREFNGYLAIYNTMEDTVPNLITDINLSILPEVDAQLVQKGFGVPTKEELSRILEDLGS
ncbi:hypothetical protein SDC9_131271 [bioreactor metagenome]|uniref:Bypass of forespore C C-terminal domain-containing protein n=1 Tax=bioreactor metagenome TaxID=1076179 RepID=A0A645D3Z1_9ZZZZ